MLFPHRFQRPDPTHIASATSFNALAYPGFFLFQPLVEKGIFPFFLFKGLFFQIKISVIRSCKTNQLAAIQLHNPGSHPPDKSTIVAHEKHGATKRTKSLLKPCNGWHIKMVAW